MIARFRAWRQKSRAIQMMENNGLCAKHNLPKVHVHPDIWYVGHICRKCATQIEAEIDAANQSAAAKKVSDLAEARRILGFAEESAK